MLIFSTHALHPRVEAELAALGVLRIASAPTEAAILAEGGDADLVVVRAPIPPDLVRREARLRALVRHGAGLDMIPVQVATGCGVLVANVPGANAVSVAEHVLWSALALLRRYPQVNAGLQTLGWDAGRVFADSGREISGLTLGILGLGNVGACLARMASQGFGMQVIAHTRRPPGPAVRAVPFDDLIAAADILALCVPLTEQTRGLVDAAALARMKPGAILVNVARGPVVDEPALIDALASGHLGGAALDVFDSQPLPPGHPLLSLPNVILTPHMAGVTQDSMLRMGQGVVAEARRIAAGELPLALVNPQAVPLYRRRFG